MKLLNLQCGSSHKEIIKLLFNTSCLVIKFNQDVNRFNSAGKQM